MGDERPALSVVVPAYNEADRLDETLRTVLGYLHARPVRRCEVIVVDDGSVDDTASVAAALAATDPWLRLIRVGPNRGKGHAVRVGVLATVGDRVLVCDADSSTPIHELDRLERALDRGADVAVASRAGRDARIGVRQPAVRERLGRAGNVAIRWLLLPGVFDTQCGFKLYDGPAARRVLGLVRTDGWGFDIEVLYLFRRAGAQICEVSVRWDHRAGSTVRPTAYLAVGADLLRLWLRYLRWAPPVDGCRPARVRSVA
ncbi:dolichyl-phosphate beta-glucosyltransferase [Actinocatenispora comari]|uniref:dolichyl-phosphate beta-glucosyltransferase n=1 Tax=Actinocatenispora comari TaxID=2807577 RepID=A0A8J4A7N1_9ACTN|nr:dolichyl-phosphate beta-glucosyltransferase [Actinocatenispora comari]GIL25189.1 glycosyl transferase [Actinocatenispora comari]